MAALSDIRSVAIHAKEIERLRELVRTHPYDFGCRAHALSMRDGDYITPALLTSDQVDQLRAEDFSVEILFDRIPDDRLAAATIGEGDRFEGGAQAPQGPGSRGEGKEHELGPIMNVDEIDSAIEGLVTEYGIPTFSLPNSTAEGSGGKGGSVGGVNPEDYHVFFTAGVHARERGGPDQLIYFIADLLYAQKHNVGLIYGAKSFTHADVIRALSTGIVFFPLVNPDGVRWDQRTDSYWRKNRNLASAAAGDDLSIGVDINRNYDFVWDYQRYFDSSVYTSSVNLASDKPHDDTFHGPFAFSEPETRNVAWVFDSFPRIRWYMDIHSAVGDILYSWGDDNDQVTQPDQNFLNPAWDAQRGIVGAPDYREWIDEGDFGRVHATARRVSEAMQSVAGRFYTAMQAANLYATSGASDDYAYSRFQSNPNVNKVYGFTMEFGYPTNFYPTLLEFHQNVIDTCAGFMEFCLAAADFGLA